MRFGSDRNAEVAERLAGIGDRIEVLPDRILIYSDNGEAALERITDARAAPDHEPRAPLEPRGRVPAPHRKDA